MTSLAARKLHRFLAYAVILPCGVTFATGLVLLLRQDFEWIQPKSQMASAAGLPTVPITSALKLAQKAYLESTTHTPFDEGNLPKPSSLEVRPTKGTWTVRFSDGFEVQLDGMTGALLSARPRRTGWLIELHQGSWFHPGAMKAVFLPSGVFLLILWLTGAWMLLPKRGRKRKAERG